MRSVFTIIYIIAFKIICLSQKETGYYVEINGNHFIRNVNNTTWVLAKIIKGKGIFKKTRKPTIEEQVKVFFKDGIAKYIYNINNKEIF
jgi:hypothetical protein